MEAVNPADTATSIPAGDVMTLTVTYTVNVDETSSVVSTAIGAIVKLATTAAQLD